MHQQHPHRITSIAIVTALVALAPRAATAADATPNALPTVLGLALDTLNGKPKPEFEDKYRPVLVTDAALPSPHGIASFGKAVTVLTREQVRQQQLAWFVELKVSAQDADAVTLTYVDPATAHFGKLFYAKVDGKWALSKREDGHSSSGARNYYGALYEGVACKDGTEMAERWSWQAEMVKTLQAGKPLDPKAKPAPTCPGDEFPEVAAYRAAKK